MSNEEQKNSFIYNIFKSFLPVEYRWYLQGMFGDRSKPFTEQDMTEDELTEIDRFIQARGTVLSPERGVVSETAYDDSLFDGTFLTPQANSIENTLGRFAYEDNPETGERTITDSYDFSNEYLDSINEHGYKGKSYTEKTLELLSRAYGKVSHQGLFAGLVDLATEAGVAYIGDDGTPVNIKYTPKKKKVIK